MKTSSLFDYLLVATRDREMCRARFEMWRYRPMSLEKVSNMLRWGERYWRRDRQAARLAIRIRADVERLSSDLDMEWIGRGTTHEAVVDGKRCGVVHQEIDHPAALNPGKWGASWYTADGGLEGTGMRLNTRGEAMAAWRKGYARDNPGKEKKDD